MFNLTLAHIRAALTFDRYRFHFQHSLALTIGVIVPIILGLYFDHLALGISAAVGAILVGVFNPDEPYPILVRTLFACLICISCAAVIGMLVSDSHLTVIIISVIVAGLCGFAGVLGPHAAVIGMLSLVTFCLFSGKGISNFSTILQITAAVFAGGLLQLTIAIRGWPFKTFYPMRRQLANAYYALGDAAQKEPDKILSPSLISILLAAKNGITYSGAVGTTAKWLNQLADQCEVLRLGLMRLAYLRENETDAAQRELLNRYSFHLGQQVHVLGETLLNPQHVISFKERSKNFVLNKTNIDALQHPEIVSIEQTLNDIYKLLSRPFPIGKSSTTGKPLRFILHPLDLIKNNIDINNIFFRHAIRLSIVIPLAWIISYALLSENQFWVPLTVAWIAKPDYVGTVPRILARVIGTILGAGLSWLIIFTFQPDTWLLVALIFASAFAVYAYLLVNYAAAVFFITGLALFLTRIAHPTDTLALIDERIFATLIAGVLALIAANIKPIFSGEKIIPSFLDLLEECKKYISLGTVDPQHIFLHAQPVKAARLKTMAFIDAAKYEPYTGKLSQEKAEKVLMTLLEAMFNVLSTQAEAAMKHQKSEIELHIKEIEKALDLLIAKFKALEDGVTHGDNNAMKSIETESNNPTVIAISKAYSYL